MVSRAENRKVARIMQIATPDSSLLSGMRCAWCGSRLGRCGMNRIGSSITHMVMAIE
ncbi:hypothetical protein D3C76_1338710 [compost metagenome]